MIFIKQQEKLFIEVTSEYLNKETSITFLANIIINNKNGTSTDDRLSVNLTSNVKSADLLSAIVFRDILNIIITSYTITNNDTEDHTIDFYLVKSNGAISPILEDRVVEVGKTLQYADGVLTLYPPDVIDVNIDNQPVDVTITTQDSPSIDAFNRWRVSGTGQRLDVEFTFDKQDEFFDEITNSGTVTFNNNSRDLTLSISDANDGTYAEMASYPIPYTPGNSQLIEFTSVLNLSNIGSGETEVFLRSSVTGSVTEEIVNQSSWNNLSEDVNWSHSQLFSIDFQSLSVGRIRYNLTTSGILVNIAEIVSDNIRDSGYWQTPNLPMYWKVYNDATYTYMEAGYGDNDNGVGFRYKILANANATMKAICCTVKSEGGLDLKDLSGLARGIDNGVTPIATGTTLIPILSIRPKATFKTFKNLGITLPKGYRISTDNPVRIAVLHDVSLTNASWVDVDTSDSMMEYDVLATALINGHLLESDYVASSAKNRITSGSGLLSKTVLWNRLGSVTGIVTIAAIKTSATDADVLAAIQWDEIR